LSIAAAECERSGPLFHHQQSERYSSYTTLGSFFYITYSTSQQHTDSPFLFIYYNRQRSSKRDLSIMASTTSIPTERRSVQELEADIAVQKTIFNELRGHGAPLQNARKQLADLQKRWHWSKVLGRKRKGSGDGGGAQQQVDGQQQPKKKERLLLKTAKVKDLSRCYHNATDVLIM
jgi:hypothetical protein